jgi:DNA-binding response OmpR family regulator
MVVPPGHFHQRRDYPFMPKLSQSRWRVLLVEDDALVAMNLQDELEEAGYTVAGPFNTCSGALGWLVNQTPDLALIDTILKDGTCKTLAAELTRRGVAFVLWSGHQQDEQTLHEFKDTAWVKKPSTHTDLLHALADLKKEAGRASTESRLQ